MNTKQLLSAALLLIVYLGAVILLQRLLVQITAVSQNELVTVLLTVVIAGVLLPLFIRARNSLAQRFEGKS